MAHKFAFESAKIKAEAISAVVWPELAQQYKVLGTTHMVLNGMVHLKGRVKEASLLEVVQSLELTNAAN